LLETFNLTKEEGYEKSKTSNRYSPEVLSRAVRIVLEHQGSYETQSAAIAAIAPKIGCIPETLRVWVRQAEKDSGSRLGAIWSCHGMVPHP
jgi:transposase